MFRGSMLAAFGGHVKIVTVETCQILRDFVDVGRHGQTSVVIRSAPPHGFEPRSSHSKCDILPLDEGGLVRPAGFEPASPRLKGEHPGPLDEGRGWCGQ